MIYCAIFFLLFLFSFSKKYNEELFIFGVVILLFITCFRSETVGIDTSSGYLLDFTYILGGANLEWIEPGWVVINKIAIKLGLGYVGVLAISGCLTILPITYIIYNKCENRCLGLAIYNGLYMILYSFNIMRQCIAISFILLSAYFYIEKKFFRTIIFFTISVLIHTSALIALIIIPFLKLDLTYPRLVFILVLSFILGIILNDRVFFMISGRYAIHLMHDGYRGFRTSVTYPAIMAFLMNLCFLFIVYSDYKKIKNNPWWIMTVISIVITNITLRMGQGTRIVQYFAPAQMLFIPKYMTDIKSNNNRKIIFLIYFMYLSMNYFRILFKQWDTVVPWIPFWK